MTTDFQDIFRTKTPHSRQRFSYDLSYNSHHDQNASLKA